MWLPWRHGQMNDDRFNASQTAGAGVGAPPAQKRSTKMLSISNMADIDNVLLASRGPSVRWGDNTRSGPAWAASCHEATLS